MILCAFALIPAFHFVAQASRPIVIHTVPLDGYQSQGFKPQSGLIPITMELEKAKVSSTQNGSGVGTNVYPKDRTGSDPVLSVPLFANDALAVLLGLSDPNLNANPLLNQDQSLPLGDWVRDTIVNNDPGSLSDALATGIIPGVTGTTFNGEKRGHWYGLRLVDGIGNADQNIFVKGGKEDDTSTWLIAPGAIGAKDDITQAYMANASFATNDLVNFPSGIEHILYFAVERRGNTGSSAYDFEFNQLPPINTYIPNRVEGDVLFTFEISGSQSSGTATPHIYVYHNGNYLNNEILANSLPLPRRPVMTMNEVETPSEPWGFVDAKGNWSLGQIPKFCVAEAAVPFDPDFLQGCQLNKGSFVQIRSRSSVSQSSDLKDMTKYFQFAFGGPTADLQLSTDCQSIFQYSGLGSHDANGGTDLAYDWRFTVPPGVSLSSQDPEFGVDPSDSTHYAAGFTTDVPRDVSVTLPFGMPYADVTVQLRAFTPGSCEADTDSFAVRIWKPLSASPLLSVGAGGINFSASAFGGKSPYFYHWQFFKKGTPDLEVGSSTESDGAFPVTVEGDYYAVLTVFDTADVSNDSHIEGKPTCSASRTTDVVHFPTSEAKGVSVSRSTKNGTRSS